MPTDVVMPQMGESIFEGTITKWLKKPGEKVQRDEPLFEISTDKVDAEIPAPASGILQEIKVSEGNTVQVNTVVGVIGDASGASVSAPAKAAAPAPAPTSTLTSVKTEASAPPSALQSRPLHLARHQPPPRLPLQATSCPCPKCARSSRNA
jgi:pyruvate dehydrogenase E2 component (dihydrolipoamide acetyltransferase)